MNDILGPLSNLANQLFGHHLMVLARQTWLLALLGWFGVHQLIRSTGRFLHAQEDLFVFGLFWAGAMALYGSEGLEGSAIVHSLAFALLLLGCFARFVSMIASGSRSGRSWGH